MLRKRQLRWEGAAAGALDLRVGLVQPGGTKSSTQDPRYHQGGVRLLMEVQSQGTTDRGHNVDLSLSFHKLL